MTYLFKNCYRRERHIYILEVLKEKRKKKSFIQQHIMKGDVSSILIREYLYPVAKNIHVILNRYTERKCKFYQISF